MASLVERLVAGGRGDPFDRHVFACAIAATGDRPLTVSLGLAPAALADLLGTYFPDARRHLPARAWGDDAGDDAIEEPDLRRLLLDHRSRGVIEEMWLAAIIARRSLGANHLWQDLGLLHRDELNALMGRHFRDLVRRNQGDMKWKKFLYRLLCEREGVMLCKAPNCEVCRDVAVCFGPEAGEPLSVLQPGVSDIGQTGRTG